MLLAFNDTHKATKTPKSNKPNTLVLRGSKLF